eukprot:862577-Prymnesium_polylepis.1
MRSASRSSLVASRSHHRAITSSRSSSRIGLTGHHAAGRSSLKPLGDRRSLVSRSRIAHPAGGTL